LNIYITVCKFPLLLAMLSNCNVLVTSSDCADDKTPRATVTSSNDECQTPDHEAAECDLPGKSPPVTSHMRLDFSHSLSADAKTDRRMRSRPLFGVFGHVSQNVGDQTTCVFDNRVYSPGSSTSSRCSDDDDEDDDETLTSRCEQPLPFASRELTCAR